MSILKQLAIKYQVNQKKYYLFLILINGVNGKRDIIQEVKLVDYALIDGTFYNGK